MNTRFSDGDTVRISHRDDERHHRVPAYVKGHHGTIVRVCAPQVQPEMSAYHKPGEPMRTVYRVRLDQNDLWSDYTGRKSDTVEIEIFEHWLESVNHAP
ncbi:MAG: nitrile hydratase subunit beta [Rhodospirillales bacterium]|nr:nitrile hydratase subunit beta [Rhodospirillales bacterium]MBT4041331.1 nitrile hydratase subunit beta [Rhodospirillales bacterium]MBT4626978.1 nitrile hydratase subunit beta [Rhodospirillales bacterium]MBT5352208.1 nitrile hydratase subunit beta [Rhodospirillales bacterium]MBT5520555.1 nitrile hydratase subunit beta [Rhodospirillales bacterium]